MNEHQRTLVERIEERAARDAADAAVAELKRKRGRSTPVGARQENITDKQLPDLCEGLLKLGFAVKILEVEFPEEY